MGDRPCGAGKAAANASGETRELHERGPEALRDYRPTTVASDRDRSPVSQHSAPNGHRNSRVASSLSSDATAASKPSVGASI
jgi:hypothetical protein